MLNLTGYKPTNTTYSTFESIIFIQLSISYTRSLHRPTSGPGREKASNSTRGAILPEVVKGPSTTKIYPPAPVAPVPAVSAAHARDHVRACGPTVLAAPAPLAPVSGLLLPETPPPTPSPAPACHK